MSGFYVFVSSIDSVRDRPRNRVDDFIVDLGRSYTLDSCGGWRGVWCMALVEVRLTTSQGEESIPSEVFMLCDLAQSSYVRGTEQPVLRLLEAGDNNNTHSTSLFQPYYIGLKRVTFSSLRIQLKNKNLDEVQWARNLDSKSVLSCTIHFQRL